MNRRPVMAAHAHNQPTTAPAFLSAPHIQRRKKTARRITESEAARNSTEAHRR